MQRENMMPLKVDLSKQGLEMCFKDYEIIMLGRQWDDPTSRDGSGILWKYVNDCGESISRASVIFAANRFVDAGIWDAVDRTGKGGHHKLYYALITESEFWDRLLATSNYKLRQK